MKNNIFVKLVFGCLFLVQTDLVHSEPLITSWFTEHSGSYAKIYETTEKQDLQESVTTWSHGQGVQALPTYAGVHQIAYTATDVYIRSSGLGFHTMGPWYGNAAKTQLFVNYPAVQDIIYRFPLTPGTPPTSKTDTGGGPIGYFIDGIAMFDSRDTFSYSNSNGSDARPSSNFIGDRVWNRDAFINESVTFDPANAHQAGSRHHYHANPPGLRHLKGDSVDYDAATNTYTENFNGKHSPILGWVRDGYPVYGPYGYSDPNDANSTVRRMISGYQERTITTRTSLPQWVNTLQNKPTTIAANVHGPDVSAAFPVGHYIEDYEYLGDVGQTLGVNFDLDGHNGRFCVTPEFPNGTFAYFTAIEPDGTPIYPYNIGRVFYGSPTGDAVTTIPTDATIAFEGGPEVVPCMESISVDNNSGDVVLTWSAIDGGSYRIENSPDATTWTDLPVKVTAADSVATLTDGGKALQDDPRSFYRSRLDSVAPFDDTGFDYDNSIISSVGNTITITLTSGGSTQPPTNLSVWPTTITINGQPVTVLSRPSQYTFELDLASLSNGVNTLSATFPDAGVWTGDYNHVANPNILLLIVDDWGIDSSPIDNNSTINPGTTFATMANLQSLAANGLRFTNAYSQPVCSPTRAALLTGRQAFRTGIGSPGDTLLASETTLPEAFTAASSPYQLASYGKWHLGGGDTGYATLGGWPEFIGITSGGVPSAADGYTNWPRNNNGITATATTYSTTDQVNEAKTFIDAREAADQPWFVWMGFNAPHTPFHEPPAALLQGGTGTDDQSLYKKALEALDTEIGRLLQSVDLSTTNVILVGDNGTPGQVVQAPFGPTGGGGHAKGDLYEGGIHVPMVVRGPSVLIPPGSTTDKLVHVTDIFSTVLEMANVAVPATGVDSNSIIPILSGSDSIARNVVTEVIDGNNHGRSIRLSDYPDYKLIIFGDPIDTQDNPTFEFYNLPADPNEGTPLNIATLTGDALAAYNAAIAHDAALGGGYSDPAIQIDTLYIELPNITGPTSPPTNLNQDPISVTVDGVTAVYSGRLDQTDTANRYWVKCTVPRDAPYSSATVTFSDNPNTGAPRVFDSIQILVNP